MEMKKNNMDKKYVFFGGGMEVGFRSHFGSGIKYVGECIRFCLPGWNPPICI